MPSDFWWKKEGLPRWKITFASIELQLKSYLSKEQNLSFFPRCNSVVVAASIVVWNAHKLSGKKLRLKHILLLPSEYNGVVSAEGNAFRLINAIVFRGQNQS